METPRRFSVWCCGLVLLLPLWLTGCDNTPSTPPVHKEILIYCGATMPKPMRVIANLFEQRHNCRVKMIKGGSGTLYRSIEINQAGDLYLPGSESYMDKARQAGLVTHTAEVGFNRAALIVAKGNPLAITPQLHNLIQKRYRTILGSPDSGSIGRETRRILTKAGLYDQAMDHALYLTSDSKGLKQAIINDDVDLTLNWYATAVWEENRSKMDVLWLDESIAPPHKLVLGVLKYARHPDLAQQFLHFAASAEGRTIFEQYGFGSEKQP